jgi:hypothetical protein
MIRSIPDLAESHLLDLALLALKETETRAEDASHLTLEELLQPGRLNVSTQIILDRERRLREQFASSWSGPPVSGETRAAA